MTSTWEPPFSRPDDVAGSPEPVSAAQALEEKWAPYSRTIQGLMVVLIVSGLRKYFDFELENTTAVLVADLLYAVGLSVGAWLVAEGRKAASAMIYWLPKTREERINKRVQQELPSLLPV